jgi:transcriptional regulator NrdR family protein
MSEQRVRGGATIPCPNCQGRTRVLQTRRQPDKTVRRERTCLSCDIIFDTNEKPIAEVLTPAAFAAVA